ncbi:MAG: type IV toxin-antitoxin system AbiEi family antitoxin [Flavobacterium sp.]
MSPQEIIHNALNNILATANIRGVWEDNGGNGRIDGKLKLQIENEKINLFADIKTEIRNVHLEKIEELAKDYHPFIVVAQRIFPKIKEELRNRNIAYLEANGNMYLRDKGLLVIINANNPIEIKDKTTNRAFTKTGLKVVYQFLINEEWINYTYRQIAEQTNTGIGNVNNIFTGLKQEGYLLQLNKEEYKIDNKKKLLEKWITEYEKRLKPTLAIGTFRFLKENDFYNWKNLQLQNGKTWWGGEPAGDLFTNYLRPEELTMYTTETRSELMKNYRLVPDTNGNVKVFKKFWEYDEVNDNLVHPLLAYTDLINKGDRRCTETAQKIYDEYLQNKF